MRAQRPHPGNRFVSSVCASGRTRSHMTYGYLKGFTTPFFSSFSPAVAFSLVRQNNISSANPLVFFWICFMYACYIINRIVVFSSRVLLFIFTNGLSLTKHANLLTKQQLV